MIRCATAVIFRIQKNKFPFNNIIVKLKSASLKCVIICFVGHKEAHSRRTLQEKNQDNQHSCELFALYFAILDYHFTTLKNEAAERKTKKGDFERQKRTTASHARSSKSNHHHRVSHISCGCAVDCSVCLRGHTTNHCMREKLQSIL